MRQQYMWDENGPIEGVRALCLLSFLDSSFPCNRWASSTRVGGMVLFWCRMCHSPGRTDCEKMELGIR